jgi:ABC-2 type transport system ATP-binding protein
VKRIFDNFIVSDIDSIARETVMIKDGKVGKMESTQRFVDAMENKVWLIRMTVDELMDYQKDHGQQSRQTMRPLGIACKKT